MMSVKSSLGAVFLVFVAACIEPFEIADTEAGNILVVEAVLTSEIKHHQVFLSRATPVGNGEVRRESGAMITIVDQNGVVVTLNEAKSGIYETPEFAAEHGNTYTLKIKTKDGQEYASAAVPFQDGADIGEVYGKYIANPDGEGKGIQIYLDMEDPENRTRYYRWSYVETYEVNAPFPSNWVWLGGNEVEFRIDGIDTCFVTDTLRNILIRSTEALLQNKITSLPLRYIPDDSYIMRSRYSILVQQFALSEEGYRYWENLKKTSEEQGSLSDVQPGSLSGNLMSLTNPDETVLGYFGVGKMTERRIILKPIDFYNDGFKRPRGLRWDCFSIVPIQVNISQLGAAMETYQSSMYIWEVYGMGEGTTFQLMPKSCCDCRSYGTTDNPPFF